MEFTLTQDIKDLGVSRVCQTKQSLYIYNGKSFAQSNFYKDELQKTLNELEGKMIHSNSFGDEKRIKKIIKLLSDIWIKSDENKQEQKQQQQYTNGNEKKEKKLKVYTNKFRDESTGILYGAVLVDKLPFFIYMDNQTGHIQKINQVDDLDRIVKPPPRNASLTDQFKFANEDELESTWNKIHIMNTDEMYSISKGISNTFIAAPDHVITLCAADTIFTYLQDRFPMTHYIFIIGDNDSGKTAFIDVMTATCYRPGSYVLMIRHGSVENNYGDTSCVPI